MKVKFHYHYHQYQWISDNTAKLLAFAQEHVACNTATCSNMKGNEKLQLQNGGVIKIINEVTDEPLQSFGTDENTSRPPTQQ